MPLGDRYEISRDGFRFVYFCSICEHGRRTLKGRRNSLLGKLLICVGLWDLSSAEVRR